MTLEASDSPAASRISENWTIFWYIDYRAIKQFLLRNIYSREQKNMWKKYQKSNKLLNFIYFHWYTILYLLAHVILVVKKICILFLCILF